jgi:predicted DNA-binding transcriptional regulator AlpA
LTENKKHTTLKIDMDKLLTEKEVAEILGVRVGTMQQWRFHKRGPKYYTIGSRTIRYRPADIEAYIKQQTSEEDGD